MNSLKIFMTKVSDRMRDAAPGSPTHIGEGLGGQVEEAVEGFVCPTCYQDFTDPETLQKHYDEQHTVTSYVCPVCAMHLDSQEKLAEHFSSIHSMKDMGNQSLDGLKEELVKLSSDLREERWHSEELKKEVGQLQEAFKKKEGEDAAQFVHKAHMDALEESKKVLLSEVVMLRKQLAEALELTGSLKTEKEVLEFRASELAIERAELRATLDTLQAEKMSLESEMHEFKAGVTLQENHHKNEVMNLHERIKSREEQNALSDMELQALKERELALQNDLKLKSELVASQKDEVKNLKLEIDKLKFEIQKSSEEVRSMERKVEIANHESESRKELIEDMKINSRSQLESIAAMEAQIEELKAVSVNKHRNLVETELKYSELHTRVDDLEKERSSLSLRLKEKSDEIQRIQEAQNDASKEESEVLQRKTAQVEELRKCVRDLEYNRELLEKCLSDKDRLLIETKEKLINSANVLKDSIAKTETLETVIKEKDISLKEFEQKMHELEELSIVITASNVEKETLQMEIVRLQEKLLSKDEVVTQLETKVKDLVSSHSEAVALYQKTEIELEREQSAKTCLVKEMQCLKSEYSTLQKEKSDVDKISSDQLNELSMLKEKIMVLDSSLSAAVADVQRKETELHNCRNEAVKEITSAKSLTESLEKSKIVMETEYNTKIESLSDEIHKLKQNLLQSQEETSIFQCQAAELTRDKESILESNENFRKELEDVRSIVQSKEDALRSLENNVSSISEEKSLLAGEAEVYRMEINKLQEQVSDEKAKFQNIIGEHQKQIASEREEKSKLTIQITELEEVRAALECKQKQQNESHNNEVLGLREDLAKARGQAEELEGRTAALDAELAGLAGDKLELEVKVESAAEEQKSLVERCLAAESEVERQQSQLNHLRRKLDDSGAALHELGRENQSLQIEAAKLAGRKWTEDSEVKECYKCGKAFSMTIRRHHCRNCGQIFCSECSSKQAPLESNKKPVRVCDSCHRELSVKLA